MYLKIKTQHESILYGLFIFNNFKKIIKLNKFMRKTFIIIFIIGLLIPEVSLAQKSKVRKAKRELEKGSLYNAKLHIDQVSENRDDISFSWPFTWIVKANIYYKYATTKTRSFYYKVTYLITSIKSCERAAKLDKENEYAEEIENQLIKILSEVKKMTPILLSNENNYKLVYPTFELLFNRYLQNKFNHYNKELSVISNEFGKKLKEKIQELNESYKYNICEDMTLAKTYWDFFITESIFDKNLRSQYKYCYDKIDYYTYLNKYKQRFPKSKKINEIKNNIGTYLERDFLNHKISLDNYKDQMKKIGIFDLNKYQELTNSIVDCKGIDYLGQNVYNINKKKDEYVYLGIYTYLDTITHKLFVITSDGLCGLDPLYLYSNDEFLFRINADSDSDKYREYWSEYKTDEKVRCKNLLDPKEGTEIYSIPLDSLITIQRKLEVRLYHYSDCSFNLAYNKRKSRPEYQKYIVAKYDIAYLSELNRNKEILGINKELNVDKSIFVEKPNYTFELEVCTLPSEYKILMSKGDITFCKINSEGKIFSGSYSDKYCQLSKINDKKVTEYNYKDEITSALSQSPYIKVSYYVRDIGSDGLYIAKPKEVIFKMPERKKLNYRIIDILKISRYTYFLNENLSIPKEDKNYYQMLKYVYNYGNNTYFIFDKGFITYSKLDGKNESVNLNGGFDLYKSSDFSIVKDKGIKIKNCFIQFESTGTYNPNYFTYGLRHYLFKADGSKLKVYVDNNTVRNVKGEIIANKNNVELSEPLDILCDTCWSNYNLRNSVTDNTIYFRWDEESITIDNDKYLIDNSGVRKITPFRLDKILALAKLTKHYNLVIIKTDYMLK